MPPATGESGNAGKTARGKPPSQCRGNGTPCDQARRWGDQRDYLAMNAAMADARRRWRFERSVTKRTLTGTFVALASMAALTAVMIPFRHHVSIATTALVLIVPVIIGTVSGGFIAGMISVGAGFLVYVFFFIQPYLTWYVGKTENWVPLGVYVVVMVPVARVVAGMNTAREKERRRGAEIRQLFELSDLLVADKPLDELLAVIVTTLAEVFGSRKVALLLPVDEKLQIVASSGEPLSQAEMASVLSSAASLESMYAFEQGDLLAIALTAAARPVGLLVLCGEAAVHYDREPLMIFANQIALGGRARPATGRGTASLAHRGSSSTGQDSRGRGIP